MFLLCIMTVLFFATVVVYVPAPLLKLLAGYPIVGHLLIHFIAVSSIGFGTDTRTALTVLVGGVGSLTLFLYGKLVGTRRFVGGRRVDLPGEWLT